MSIEEEPVEELIGMDIEAVVWWPIPPIPPMFIDDEAVGVDEDMAIDIMAELEADPIFIFDLWLYWKEWLKWTGEI